ncbi:hypothetical protein [Spirobacillus cienkowskii]|uniref:hypothetical protein n=1 Tax=Spirobacillus cienkowskii TaxID=495820 RepID=UPI0030D1F036
MHRISSSILITTLLITGCFDNPAIQNQNTALTAASCPTSDVRVIKVTFNEAKQKYSVFHTAATAGKALPNPLTLKNLQMMQIEPAANSQNDFAQLHFNRESNECTPILQMTQGYKIEIAATGGASQQEGQSSGGASGSYWAPFLMGAMVGNTLSGAFQSRQPTYYLPPPNAGGNSSGGVISGGVSGKNPDELKKNYATQAENSKKGFFSKRNNQDSKQKSGFFSKKENSSKNTKTSFFRKKSK